MNKKTGGEEEEEEEEEKLGQESLTGLFLFFLEMDRKCRCQRKYNQPTMHFFLGVCVWVGVFV